MSERLNDNTRTDWGSNPDVDKIVLRKVDN